MWDQMKEYYYQKFYLTWLKAKPTNNNKLSNNLTTHYNTKSKQVYKKNNQCQQK